MNDSRTAFFEKYAAAAMEEQKRYGIPASVTLAQMALESYYGQSALARQDNNYFGIKASKSWLDAGKPWSYHHDDKPNEKFCTFGSALESLEYHSKVLMASRYKACLQYSSDDHYNWIVGIKNGGYATAGNYVSSVESIIKQYGLDRFDRQAIAEAQQQGIRIGYMRNAKGGSSFSSVPSNPVLLAPEASRYSFPLERTGTMAVTSNYGPRVAPKAGASTNHKGLDLMASYEPILSTEDNGRVISVTSVGKGGTGIHVESSRVDGTKYQVSYLHLSKVNVNVGDTVMAGQKIGVSGNTGNSTGPHLHFSVKKVSADGYSQHIDPSLYLAEIAVRGNINTKVLYKGTDLTAHHKANMQVGVPQQAVSQNALLADLTKSDNPKDWLSYLMSNGDKSMIAGSSDPIATLIGSVFSGLFMMMSQLEMDDENNALAYNSSQSMSNVVSSKGKDSSDIVMERPRTTVDLAKMSQSASAFFEAGMQEGQKQDNAVALK